MLEQKLNGWKNKVGIGLLGLSLLGGAYSCAPSAVIPTKIGNMPTGIDCCAALGCSSRGYDTCKNDGGEIYNPNTGNFEQQCYCYDYYTPGGSSSTTSGGTYKDSGPDGADRSDRGGHKECFSK